MEIFCRFSIRKMNEETHNKSHKETRILTGNYNDV